MYVEVQSKVYKKAYEINRMSEYNVETSLDIPADYFNIIIENPVDNKGFGLNADVFNPNDTFKISENYGIILNGVADDTDEYWDEGGSKIELSGRDISMLLLENDAEPRTYNKLKLSAFINKIAGPYGFKAKVNSKYDKVINKIVVEVGDSEWDCIFRETKKLDMWLWCEPDGTLVADKLNYSGAPSYKFSNDLSIDAIRIKKFSKKKRGADIKNEVWVRGQGKKAFTAKYKDNDLTNKGYKRRMIIEDGEAKNIKDGQDKGKKLVQERKRGSFEIELTINGKHEVKTNKTAYVKDKVTKTEGTFFIVGVRDKKNDNIGHEKIIRLRPLWEGL